MVILVIWVWRYDCKAVRIVVGVIEFAPLKNLVKQLCFLFFLRTYVHQKIVTFVAFEPALNCFYISEVSTSRLVPV